MNTVIVTNQAPIRIGPNTRVVVMAGGEQFEVPIRELDTADLARLHHTIEVLLAELQQ